MMKKIFTYIATGLFLVCLSGISQGAGRDWCCEDMSDAELNMHFNKAGFASSDKGQKTIVPKVSDRRDWCCEDMSDAELNTHFEKAGFASSDKGQKTIVPKVSDRRDWCCEDMSDEEINTHFEKANKIMPAAGN